jgi:hypothetical protein
VACYICNHVPGEVRDEWLVERLSITMSLSQLDDNDDDDDGDRDDAKEVYDGNNARDQQHSFSI